MSGLLLLIVFAFSFSIQSYCQAKEEDRLALTNVNIIDGKGGAPQNNMTVVIEAGIIRDIFPAGRKPLPKDYRVIELKGMYVLPGLIDTHVHLTGGYRSPEEADALLKFALMGGVTAVRDMGGDAIEIARLAENAKNNTTLSPRIYFSALMAGPTWFKDPRAQASAHGQTAGEIPWLKAITPETDIAQAVSQAKATGATGIKIYANLSADLTKKVTAEAHRQGLKVWSHATIFPARPGDAVNAGIDSISHAALLIYEAADKVPEEYHSSQSDIFALYSKTPANDQKIIDLLQKMKREGKILDATLYVTSLLAQRSNPNAAADPRLKWTYEVTKLARENGVTLVTGTDGMGRPGRDEVPNIHQEMELLVTMCGLTPAEAVTAATLNGAKALGVENLYGTVSKSKAADLLILRKNPLENIRHTREIYAVIKGGRFFRKPN